MDNLTKFLVILGLLMLLLSCGADKGQMLQQLETLEMMNRADSVMKNDSLAESLVEYFDNNGTPNERMRARYILGRTYFDLGELPRALETYLDAANCADTTSADCDFKTLSRIHAQSANIFNLQIQPRSQLRELRMAEYYAMKGNDSLMAVECYSEQANAYDFLNMPDSIIIIVEESSRRFSHLGNQTRSAQIKSLAITSLINRGDLTKAKDYIDDYEKRSSFFDSLGGIEAGRKIYYYTKGRYYMATGALDSAEIMFRRELKEGSSLNHYIAGFKGLQGVYTLRKTSDSIAKYANLGYEYNDSAYSLSEMQNIQKLQASYNYNYNKLLSEQNMRKAERANSIIIIIVCLFLMILVLLFFIVNSHLKSKKLELLEYQKDLDNLEKAQTELMYICSEESLPTSEILDNKNREIKEIFERVAKHQQKTSLIAKTLEERLNSSAVVFRLRNLISANPYQRASHEDLRNLRKLINVEIPQFYSILNTPQYTLSPNEYDVTLLLRVHFSPMEIHKLTGISPSYISNMRSRLLMKVFGEEGSPKDYDTKILAIK